MRPVLLPPNGVPRFYRGGPAITALRGVRFEGDRVPEEWIGSTAAVFGEGEPRPQPAAGRRAAARRDPPPHPRRYLGAAHVARFGPDPALLVKLLDAGERLPVHVHPDGAFAAEHLGTRFGKTEAWIVVGADRPGHRGPRRAGARTSTPDTLAGWVRDQDRDAMLGALNRVPVGAGDAVFVPAGAAARDRRRRC